MLAVIDGAQPRNETEAMLAAQMAVTHLLAMQMADRLSRATNIPQRDLSALALARLSRTFTTQVETFAKLRRGGEQKVTVKHVHVHSGGQAIVGDVTHNGGRHQVQNNNNPMQRQTPMPKSLLEAPRCGAKTRSGTPCQSPAVSGKRRCRMHGGAPGSGAPKGERNGNYRHGRRTAEAMAEGKTMNDWLRRVRKFAGLK